MSDFPMADKYRNKLSLSQVRYLKEHGWDGGEGALPIAVKKEKGSCLYDIDDNKYTDFYLNNGSAIAGHNHRTLTQFIKNGLSSGSSTGNFNKFLARLAREFDGIRKYSRIAFYNQASGAYAAVIRALCPKTIGVTSDLILRATRSSGAEMAVKGKHYDLVFFEPVDFDGKLEDVSVKTSGWKADKTCAVESRTAFRFHYGFLTKPGDADIVLAADSIANGMDSAVVLTDSPLILESENLPIFKSVAILETLKYFARHISYADFGLERFQAVNGKDIVFRKNVFKILKDFDPSAFLPYGVHMRGKTGFLCTEHTEFDWKRLEKALEMTGNK